MLSEKAWPFVTIGRAGFVSSFGLDWNIILFSPFVVAYPSISKEEEPVKEHAPKLAFLKLADKEAGPVDKDIPEIFSWPLAESDAEALITEAPVFGVFPSPASVA